MFDNTRPVAANARRVSSSRVFETAPERRKRLRESPPQGDGVSCETARLGEVVEEKICSPPQFLFQRICENTHRAAQHDGVFTQELRTL